MPRRKLLCNQAKPPQLPRLVGTCASCRRFLRFLMLMAIHGRSRHGQTPQYPSYTHNTSHGQWIPAACPPLVFRAPQRTEVPTEARTTLATSKVASPRQAQRKPIRTSGQVSNLAKGVWRIVPSPLTVVPSAPLPNVVACLSAGQGSYSNL